MPPDLISALQADLLRQPNGSIHLMGIAGVGMAGLAGLLAARGYHVTGCDLSANRLTARLNQMGISTVVGHAPSHIDADLLMVVRSTALSVDHPECRAARALNIPVYRRGEVLAALLRSDRTVAVSGTHGKTTTTALIAHLLRAVGESPSFYIGGEWEESGRVFESGSGGIMVAETDESDGTLAYYQPDIAVITSLDFDHMEHFADEAAFISVFRSFAQQAREAVIYCADDPTLAKWVRDLPGAVSYGFSPDAYWRARIVEEGAGTVRFEVYEEGRSMGTATLSVPGRHNAQNALAALTVVGRLKLPVVRALEALATFRPVRRRFERVGVWNGATVYSDYAHHPGEIRALIQAARQGAERRVFAIFQPHRYTRTRALGAHFPAAFEGIDHLLLAPVYAASEAPLPGGTAEDLEAHFQAHGNISFERLDTLADAWPAVRDRLQPGDLLLIVGAGDVERVVEEVRCAVERERDS